MKVKTARINDSLFRIEKKFRSKVGGFGNDISGPYWMLISLKASKPVFWRVNGTLVRAPSNPTVFYVPPFSWTAEFVSAGTTVEAVGYISSAPPSIHAPNSPCFVRSANSISRVEVDLDGFWQASKPGVEISVRSNPGPLSIRIKNAIDRSYTKGILLNAIANKLGTSASFASRQFKRDFSFPPKYYERGLRVTHAMFLLLTGMQPARAAQSAGYRDLGRFYKQFAQYVKTTPKSHQRKKSKIAKKSR